MSKIALRSCGTTWPRVRVRSWSFRCSTWAGRLDQKLEKVALFRSLFSGRTDVFPKLWRNSRTKKQGYAPACGNEWVHGVCEKPRVKCGECPNQAFLDVTDEVLFDHLQGRHVAGVYPLMEDETCRFLAVDFDKGHWQGDVAAYVETGRRFGLTPAVERSRSGGGARSRGVGQWKGPWLAGRRRHRQGKTKPPGCACPQDQDRNHASKAPSPRRSRPCSRNRFSWRRRTCRRLSSTGSTAWPRSGTRSSMRSRPCGSRRP